MGREKDELDKVEQGRFLAAKKDDRRCKYCDRVIPYGEDVGQHGECGECVGALKDD